VRTRLARARDRLREVIETWIEQQVALSRR